MKKNLISKHCQSRKAIDKLAQKLGISPVGPRQSILNAIQEKSYSQIKQALS